MARQLQSYGLNQGEPWWQMGDNEGAPFHWGKLGVRSGFKVQICVSSSLFFIPFWHLCIFLNRNTLSVCLDKISIEFYK